MQAQLSGGENFFEKKGGFSQMRKMFAVVSINIVLSMILAFGSAWAGFATPDTPGKVGDEAYTFTLPSSQGKLVDYYKDYYGKYNLVMTFFPAAFTPV
jgi:hypothetical protein